MRYLLAFVVLLTGCAQGLNQTTTGTLAGGTLGAGLGAIIGGATGHAGPGIAIGAAAGALGGALVGNSLDSQDRENQALRDNVSRQQAELDANRRLLDELRRKGADARITDRGVVINLPDVLFEFNQSRLTSDAMATVSDISSVLRKDPNRMIRVEGHTDNVGSVEYNDRLSQRRADRVANELEQGGISSRNLSVVGYGESRPVASNATSAGRQRNRRVEVIVENAR